MIILYAVQLKEFFEKEHDYPWKMPGAWARCNSCTVWGHGYSEANFDGYLLSPRISRINRSRQSMIQLPRPKEKAENIPPLLKKYPSRIRRLVLLAKPQKQKGYSHAADSDT